MTTTTATKTETESREWSREWLEAAIADFEERAADADYSEQERERAARWAKIYKEILAEQDEADWSKLCRFYLEKGDRWEAESLYLLAKGGAAVVSRLTQEARDRLREPLAIVVYNPELQTLSLYGEKMAAVCTSILGQAPQDAGDALDWLVNGYLRRVMEHVDMGYPYWAWNGKAPWER